MSQPSPSPAPPPAGDYALWVRQTLRAIAAHYRAELGLPSLTTDDVLVMVSLVGGCPSRQALVDAIIFAANDAEAAVDHVVELEMAAIQPDGSVRATTLMAQIFGRLLPITQHHNTQWRTQMADQGVDPAALDGVLAMLRQDA